MSYQVLARKWRPRKFSELVGQEHVVTAIANALDNDRLHHAYLFTGTRGVGKTTIARIFSKSLNCEQGQGANPCGVCDTCREIEQGNYVDLLEIDAASRTKVEDTRELLDNVQYKPTRGRYKVYLIDEVHMLSKHSFNALLKTLEEPPPHVKFLLATTDPQKLPITILSRCLQFNLKALSREQISGQLENILGQESIPFEPQALALLARSAQGSMRDALSLTDQAIAQGDNQVLAGVVTDMLGLMDRHQILKVLYALVKKQPAEMMSIVADMAEQSPDYGVVLSELSSLLHQIALTQWIPDACKLETTSAKAIYQLAKAMPAEQVQLFYQIALQGKKDLPYAVDGRSGLEMTLLRMMSFAPEPDNDDNLTLIIEGEGGVNTPVVNHTAATTTSATQSAVKPQIEPHMSEATEASDTVAVEAPVVDTVNQQTTEQDGPSVVESNAEPFAQSAAEQSPEGNAQQIAEADEAEQHTLNQQQSEIEAMAAAYRQADSIQPTQTEAEADAQAAPQNLHTDAYSPGDNSAEPPVWDDVPLEHYDDAGYGYMHDDDAGYEQQNPAPDPVASQQPEPASNLTSIEDMLALRQQLKNGRKEADESQEKKSADSGSDTTERVRQLSQRRQASAPSEEEASPSQTSPTDVVVADATDADEPPPWTTDALPDAATANDVAAQDYETQPQAEHVVDARADVDSGTTVDVAAAEPSVQSQDGAETFAAEEADTLQHAESVEATTASKAPASSVQLPDGNKLTAYLPDGAKLLRGRQIDNWSELVSRLGLVGLTKQIVLNSAFSREGNQVTLELDRTQDHLINDNAVAQLKQALSDTLEAPVELTINLGEPAQTPLTLQAKIEEMRQEHARYVVHNDESFTKIQQLFSASVKEESILPRD